DELDALLHLGRRRPEAGGEERGVGRRCEAAGEVVDAAVAFGLAEDGDDVGGVDLAGVQHRREAGDVVGGGGREAVNLNALHGNPPLFGGGGGQAPALRGTRPDERYADRGGESSAATETGENGQ